MAPVLGIDWGKARIGLAVSDEAGILASPYRVVDARVPDQGVGAVAGIITDQQISQVVIGLPVTCRGEQQESHTSVLKFIDRLQQKCPQVKVEKVDERFTSVMAENRLRQAPTKKKKRRDKGRVDQSAAAIILQEWLDRDKDGI